MNAALQLPLAQARPLEQRLLNDAALVLLSMRRCDPAIVLVARNRDGELLYGVDSRADTRPATCEKCHGASSLDTEPACDVCSSTGSWSPPRQLFVAPDGQPSSEVELYTMAGEWHDGTVTDVLLPDEARIALARYSSEVLVRRRKSKLTGTAPKVILGPWSRTSVDP